MTYSRDLLIAELERDEGNRGDLYYDTLGNPTIGIGHNLKARPLSQPEIDYIFGNDLAGVEMDLDRAFPWWRTLDDVRQRVLINLCFNLGISGLQTFHNTLAAIRDGDYASAAKGLRGSLWAQQVRARAERLAHMMATGTKPT